MLFSYYNGQFNIFYCTVVYNFNMASNKRFAFVSLEFLKRGEKFELEHQPWIEMRKRNELENKKEKRADEYVSQLKIVKTIGKK